MAVPYKVILDFLVGLKLKPGEAEKIGKEAEALASKLSTSIDFDSENAKKNIKEFISFIKQTEGDFDGLKKALTDITLEIETEEAQNALKSIERMLEDMNTIDLTEFDNVLSKLSDTDLSKIQAQIQEAIDTDNAKAFGKEIEKMSNEFEKSAGELQRTLGIQKQALAQMKITGQQGSESYKRLEKEVAASEEKMKQLQEAIAGANGELQNMPQKLSLLDRIEKFGEISDGIQQLGEAFASLSEPFVVLDTATQKIKTLGGAAREMAPQFRNISLAMSKEVPIAAGAIQEATYQALSAGIKATEKDIAAFMDSSAKLAVGGAETIGNSVDLLSSVLNAYGAEASKTAKFSDTLFNTVNLGKTTIPELQQGLANVVPTAAAVGISLENVGASLALMTANGIPTATATSKLNQLFVELQKPGTELAVILENAGVSLESLANESFPTTIGKIREALEAAGTTATQAFSSTEASASFNVLAKDVDRFKETLAGVEDTTGSTEAAFKDMSEGIENQVALMKSQTDAFIVSVIDSAGSFGTLSVYSSQLLQEMNPMITALAGMKTVFGGMAGNIKDVAIQILSRLVPGLVVQTAAQTGVATATTAATAAQVKFNLAALANPYILAGAALIGAVVAIKAIASALHDTAEEMLDNAKAEEDYVKAQIDNNRKRQDTIKSNQKLIESYEQLSSQTKLSTSDQEKLRDVELQLARTYPGVIQGAGKYSENLKLLRAESAKGNEELKQLHSSAAQLTKEKILLQVEIQQLEAHKVKEQMEDTLTESMSGFSWGDVGVAAADAFSLGFASQAHYAMTGESEGLQKVGNIINEAIFGTSNARQQAEKNIKVYTDGIYKAQNKEQLAKAAQELQLALFDPKKFGSLDSATKNKLLKQSVEFVRERGEAMEAEQRASTAMMTELLALAFDTDNLDPNQIKNIAEVTGKSIQDVEAALIKQGTKSIALGAKNTDVYEKLAKAMKKSPEEVEKLVSAQKKSVEETLKQEGAIESLAKKWQEITKIAGEKLNTVKDEMSLITLQLRNGELTKEQYNEKIKLLKKEGIEQSRLLNTYNKIRESVENTFKIYTAADILDRFNKIYDVKKKELALDSQQLINAIEYNVIKEKRTKDNYDELAILGQQYDTLLKSKSTMNELLKQQGIMVEKGGKLVFSPSFEKKDTATKEAKQAVLDSINAMNLEIEQNQHRIESLRTTITIDQKELDKRIEEIEEKAIELDVEFGGDVSALDNLALKYGAKLADVRKEISRNNKALIDLQADLDKKLKELPETASAEDRLKLINANEQKKNIIKKGNAELLEIEHNFQEKIIGLIETGYSKRNEMLSDYYDRLMEKVRTSSEKEIDYYSKINANYARSLQSASEGAREQQLRSIDKYYDEQQKKLDKYRDREYVSELEYEKRRQQLQEDMVKERENVLDKHRKKQLADEAFMHGAIIEMQRAKDALLLQIEGDSLQQQKKFLEDKKNLIDEATGRPLFTPDDMKEYDKISKRLEEISIDLGAKGEIIGSVWEVIQQTNEAAIPALFAADWEGAADSLRQGFASILGVLKQMLEKIIEAAALKMLGDWLNFDPTAQTLPLFIKLGLIPATKILISSLLNTLAQPILNSLTSFSTGGRIDNPQLAIIGDGSNLGARNREWIFTDPQLISTMEMVANRGNKLIEKRLANLENIMQNEKIVGVIRGEDLRLVMVRANKKTEARSR